MIVCIGESLIDVVEGKNIVGGCPLNVAVAASRLGSSVALFSKVSGDDLGTLILDKLIDDCVMFEPHLCSSPLPTMKGHAVVDSEGRASYAFDWEGSASVSLSREELIDAFSSMTDVDFVMTGSLGTVLPPSCNAIFPAIEAVQPHPVVLYDPNVRPALISNMEKFKHEMMQFVKKCDIVKVSDEDLHTVFGEDESERNLEAFCNGNSIHVIVTRGKDGSSWIAPGFRVDVPAQTVPHVVDTIGCGDTFTGAVLSALQRRKDGMKLPVSSSSRICLDALGPEEARTILDFASKASALNCMEKGCNPPHRDGCSDCRAVGIPIHGVEVQSCQTT